MALNQTKPKEYFMYYAMNLKGNTKTQIPTTTSGKQTCPDTCPLKVKGCYAKNHFMGAFWEGVTNGTAKNLLDFSGLLESIKSLKNGQLWRLNQAGDLPHNNGFIDGAMVADIVEASSNKKGFTYTHHVLNDENKAIIKEANSQGFTINISTNNLQEVDEHIKKHGDNLPLVTLLQLDAESVTYTQKGKKVVACPYEKNKKLTCKVCKLCANSDRDYVIGFRAHGSAKKSVDIIARG